MTEMTEMEKVVKGLEEAFEVIAAYVPERYWGYSLNACKDALALLKAQEPMLVKHTISTIRCPKCNKQITSRGAIHKEIKYCWKCGQAVKWE